MDPPCDVGADFSMDIEVGGETFHKEPNLLEQIAYRDTWGRAADSFLAMIYERLLLMRDPLHEANADFVTLTMSAVKLSTSTPDDGETGLKRTYQFTAYFNSAGGASLATQATTIQVQDSAA